MKNQKLVGFSLTVCVALGLLGMCKVGSTIESDTRKLSQYEAQNNLHVVYDLESLSTPWCVLALLEGKDKAEGEVKWRAGEIATLGDNQFYTLGYGESNLSGPVTVLYRGETYKLESEYSDSVAGMYSYQEAVEVLNVERTCGNVEIRVK
jgi:hypothetical protein